MGAPGNVGALRGRKDGRYYLFFAANDVKKGEIGGIGVAVADSPAGPLRDLLGKPLINDIINGAQPIDQFVFQDETDEWWIVYGGWGHLSNRVYRDYDELFEAIKAAWNSLEPE